MTLDGVHELHQFIRLFASSANTIVCHVCCSLISESKETLCHLSLKIRCPACQHHQDIETEELDEEQRKAPVTQVLQGLSKRVGTN
jgi:ribosomal protein S27E